MSVNKVMLLGHVGKDVDVHTFSNGSKVARFPLATNETYKDKQTGEKITNTEWHKIVANGKVIDILKKHVTKGVQLFIEGKIKTRSWETEGGIRYQTEIHLLNFAFTQSKGDKAEAVDAEIVHNDSLPW